MFGIGTFEFLVIILVGILVLGPEQLPRVIRTVTKVMSDFRRISTDFQRAVNLQVNQEEYRQKHGEEAFQTANKALGTKKKKKKKKAAGTEEADEASLAVKKVKRKKKKPVVSTETQQTATRDIAAAANADSAADDNAALTAGNDSPGGSAGGVSGSPASPVEIAEPSASTDGTAPYEPSGAHENSVVQADSTLAASSAEEGVEVPEERFRQIRESLRSKGIDPDTIPTQGGRA